MKKNSDKFSWDLGIWCHRLGFFLPLVIHLSSEKSILPKFSSLRGVAVSVSFPRKETECGLVEGPYGRGQLGDPIIYGDAAVYLIDVQLKCTQQIPPHCAYHAGHLLLLW